MHLIWTFYGDTETHAKQIDFFFFKLQGMCLSPLLQTAEDVLLGCILSRISLVRSAPSGKLHHMDDESHWAGLNQSGERLIS